MIKKIAVITPVSHLVGIKELLDTKGEIFYLEDNPIKSKVRVLLETKDIDTIVCNPNQQSFKIDKQLLNNTKVKIINSCSTGLNHIDLRIL